MPQLHTKLSKRTTYKRRTSVAVAEVPPIPDLIKNAPVVGYEEETGEEPVGIEFDFLGRPMKSKATRLIAAQLAEGNRLRAEHQAENQETLAAAQSLYISKPTAKARQAYLEAISNVVGLCGSHERAEIMMNCIMEVPSEIFWPVVIDNWCARDNSWHVAGALVALMRIHGGKDRRKWMSPEQRKIYDALPDLVKVWRGTARSRVRSIAWSTRREAAEGFATGMRGGPFADPVIAQAFIPKEAIFWADDGSEAEIVLDPRRLRKLSVESFDNGKLKGVPIGSNHPGGHGWLDQEMNEKTECVIAGRTLIDQPHRADDHQRAPHLQLGELPRTGAIQSALAVDSKDRSAAYSGNVHVAGRS
jgi:hypothetical protein